MLVDPSTGEIKEHNWHYIDRIANSYHLYDRCYRKGDRFINSGIGDYLKGEADYEE